MLGVARLDIDVAGGTITDNPVEKYKVFANGYPIAVLGAIVSHHGRSIHKSSTMIEASEKVFAYGISVCRESDEANCGHSSSGSENVKIGPVKP